MSFAPIPPPPAPPAEPRPRRFSRTHKAVMAAGLAAGLALGGAGISYAASSGSPTTTTPPKPSTPTTPNAPFKPGHEPRGFGPGRFGLGFGFGFGGGRVVHGQATVQTSKGYQTIAFQVGTVDPNGVSATSLSVTSTDKYLGTYVVTPATMVDAQRDGISDVKAGDQVEVTATVSGNTQTAVSIIDLTQTKNSRNSFGFGAPADGPGNPDGSAHTAEAGAF